MSTGADTPPKRRRPRHSPTTQALIERYARKLPMRLDELADKLAALRARPGDPELREQARAAAHTLRGTAGSFGFPRVSEQIGRIDDAVRRAGPHERIDLDALDRAVNAAQELVRNAPGPSQAEVESWKARLLYLDPDPEACERVQEIGRRRLIDVLIASSLQDAQRRLGGEEVDGALVELPGGEQDDDAAELARALRAIPGNASLPLAFVSADEATPSRVRAANAGAALFLGKPLSGAGLDEAASHLAAIRRASEPRVLILDDDDAFATCAASSLGQGGVVVRTLTDPDDLLGLLESTDPEALLLDVRMPGIDGLDICRMLRTTSRWQDLPILMITADTRAETRLAAYGAGCDDVLLKPVLADELRLRVKLRVERRRLLQARAERDPLTDLPLRRWFIDRLRARLSEAHRRGLPISLVLLDLDHFKEINDRYGHLAGDRALARLGHLLAARFRSEDLRARWGGEEFIAAFPGERAETAATLARNLLHELEHARIESDDGAPFTVSFSAGIAEFPRDGASMEALLRAVDRRLYAAKAAGRSRVIHREEA
jgi:diguanylate cyclase (GGDEF)-like protein